MYIFFFKFICNHTQEIYFFTSETDIDEWLTLKIQLKYNNLKHVSNNFWFLPLQSCQPELTYV